jgi:hypothetical protein
MKEMYFIISNPDGDTTVEAIEKKELIARLEDNYYGSGRLPFPELPDENDTNYWGEGFLIIKGSVVYPKAKEVITKFDIE